MAFASVWRFFLTQATAFDMRRVADALQLLFPRVKVVSLQAVAAHTRESLTKQASLVTKEILSVLKTAEWLRISFISHSIGSLVLRLAIQSPLLNPYRSKYHLFLSLNAPHLGVLFPKWTLEWGSKFVSFFNDAKVVQELLLKEEKKQRNTLLYKMALNSGWGSSTVSCRVRGVSLPVLLFVMSGYSPFHSERAETNPGILAASGVEGEVYQEMVNGFWSSVRNAKRPVKVKKFDVQYDVRLVVRSDS